MTGNARATSSTPQLVAIAVYQISIKKDPSHVGKFNLLLGYGMEHVRFNFINEK